MKKNALYYTLVLLFFIGTTNISGQNKNTDNKSIISLLKKKRAYNKGNGAGFRIQLYYGNERKAKGYLSKFKNKFPRIYTKLNYRQPYWKVKVGSYRDKLDAEIALNKIRAEFSEAIIVKE